MKNDSSGDYLSPETEDFHNLVREVVILFLCTVILIAAAHLVIDWLKDRQEREFFMIDNDDDQQVYRVALTLCTLSFAATWAAFSLLPFSIITNEILVICPNSYYTQWLNSSLVQLLWNTATLLNSVTFFVLIPFAYLFLESQGFPNSTNNLLSRMFEACSLHLMVFIAILGVASIVSSQFFSLNVEFSVDSLANFFDIISWYALLLSSTIKLLGVILLLMTFPVGLVTLMTWLSKTAAKLKPRLTSRRSFSEHVCAAQMDEESLQVKLKFGKLGANGWHFQELSDTQMEALLFSAIQHRKDLEYRQQYWWTSLLYILVLLVIVFLWINTFAYILYNIINLVRDLFNGHSSKRIHTKFSLGNRSLSSFGWFGVSLQIALVVFFFLSNLFGIYNFSPINRLKPIPHTTSLANLLANCAILLLFASSLPLQTQLLGITNFSVLSTFRQPEWQNNSHLILLYDIVFLLGSTLYTLRRFIPVGLELSNEVFGLCKAIRRLVLQSAKRYSQPFCSHSFQKVS